ncbi:hypothetical protein [Parasphingorhabdus sp.]|uniref:hypothetical protein n=1 Tax=Parasphingorhabdus sp. TaxID=2709688 RepID=UPI00359491D8
MPKPAAPSTASSRDRLIIVYNADEGWASALMDAAHKLVRPETYSCSLCMISYGAVSMRRPWRDYLDALSLEKSFYHRQDFACAYPAASFPITQALSLPAILIEDGGDLHCLLSSDQLDRLSDVDSLMAALDRALAQFRT